MNPFAKSGNHFAAPPATPEDVKAIASGKMRWLVNTALSTPNDATAIPMLLSAINVAAEELATEVHGYYVERHQIGGKTDVGYPKRL